MASEILAGFSAEKDQQNVLYLSSLNWNILPLSTEATKPFLTYQGRNASDLQDKWMGWDGLGWMDGHLCGHPLSDLFFHGQTR